MAGKNRRAFEWRTDEVAILAATPKRKALQFLIPAKLRRLGTIPFTSTAALAAKTAREKARRNHNNFSYSRHASVFEGVPMGGRKVRAIQKIMSAPIFGEDKTVGVVQISRKAAFPEEAGTDLPSDELRKLQSVAGAGANSSSSRKKMSLNAGHFLSPRICTAYCYSQEEFFHKS